MLLRLLGKCKINIMNIIFAQIVGIKDLKTNLMKDFAQNVRILQLKIVNA